MLAALEARLRELNPRAPLIDGDTPEAPAAPKFSNAASTIRRRKIADVGRWLQDEAEHDHHHDHDHTDCGHDHHHHHHDVNRHGAEIRSFAIVHDRPIDPMALEMFIDLLRSAHGEKLLRMKAVVAGHGPAGTARWCCTACRASSTRRERLRRLA